MGGWEEEAVVLRGGMVVEGVSLALVGGERAVVGGGGFGGRVAGVFFWRTAVGLAACCTGAAKACPIAGEPFCNTG